MKEKVIFMFDEYIVHHGEHPVSTEQRQAEAQGIKLMEYYKDGTHTIYKFPKGDVSLIHFPHHGEMFGWTYEIMDYDGEIFRSQTIEGVNAKLKELV
jgi:hypothetical protein